MRDAIGGSMLLYLVIFFVSAVMLFFVSTLSYVKAYRVKNRIINIVEGYDFSGDFNEEKQKSLISTINSDLTIIGYNTSSMKNCSKDSNYNCTDINAGGTYDYCLCRIERDNGYFFEVITYTQFRLPILESILSNSVHGETKLLGVKYEY